MTEYQKIAVLCNYELLPERVGGMDYFFWLFDRKCKENNIQVDWFFPNQSSHGEYAKLNILNCNYHIEPFFLDFCRQNKTEYAQIITHFVELCTPFFYQIKQLSKAKVIAVDHNPRPLGGYPFKKKIEKSIKGILFSRYIDVFVGVSDYSKNQMVKEYGIQVKMKSILIFNGIEFSKFKKKETYGSNNRFMVASHLRIEKGIQDLIKAVHLLNSQFNFDFTIDIYGEGYYEIDLKRMIDKYDLHKFFNFKGSVSNLYEIYRQYDYLIHPSHGETFCYSVVESLWCNLPVITTKKQGNVLELVEENKNGFLFDVSQIKELENILCKILNQTTKIDDCSEVNKKVNDLTLEKMVDNHLALVLKNKL